MVETFRCQSTRFRDLTLHQSKVSPIAINVIQDFRVVVFAGDFQAFCKQCCCPLCVAFAEFEPAHLIDQRGKRGFLLHAFEAAWRPTYTELIHGGCECRECFIVMSIHFEVPVQTGGHPAQDIQPSLFDSPVPARQPV